MNRRFELRGAIVSAGFASGDRFTVGHWDEGPLGAMADVMWARPDGERVLLSDSRSTEEFVQAVYEFDRSEVVPFRTTRTRRRLVLSAGPLTLDLRAGAPVAFPPLWLRPPWVTRYVEAPISRAALGVSTYGSSPTGVAEWYRATLVRRVVGGEGTLDGVGLGALAPVDPPLRVGFAEPPKFPSFVLVQPLLEDPSARLDRVLDRYRTGVADLAAVAS